MTFQPIYFANSGLDFLFHRWDMLSFRSVKGLFSPKVAVKVQRPGLAEQVGWSPIEASYQWWVWPQKKDGVQKGKDVTTITEDLRKQIYALYIVRVFSKKGRFNTSIEGEHGACAYLLKLLHVKSNLLLRSGLLCSSTNSCNRECLEPSLLWLVNLPNSSSDDYTYCINIQKKKGDQNLGPQLQYTFHLCSLVFSIKSALHIEIMSLAGLSLNMLFWASTIFTDLAVPSGFHGCYPKLWDCSVSPGKMWRDRGEIFFFELAML